MYIARVILCLIIAARLVGEGYGKPPVPGAIRASYYGRALEGHRMANGRRFHAASLTCATFRYPLGSFVEVTSVATGRVIVIEVTDRGPLGKMFGIDLSEGSYKALGLRTKDGWGWVVVRKYE